METLWRDLRYAARMLSRSPGFTIVGGLILALGIGANTAIFGIVDAVLLRPLPYRSSERLVAVKNDLRGPNIPDVGMSAPELWDFRDRSGVFEELSEIWPINNNLTGSDRPMRIETVDVGLRYFDMLGVKPQLGRLFEAHDYQPGFAEAVVISDGLWRSVFGTDPRVLGRRVRLDNDMYTIIGVLPRDFHHPWKTLAGDVGMWITAGYAAPPFNVQPKRFQRMLPGAIGLLKPGLTVAQAQAKLEAFAGQLKRQFPSDYPEAWKWTPRLVPLQDELVGKVRPMLLVVLGAVGFVLLICSVSLANLVLARSSARQRETAVRVALGASQGHLIRQVLSESVLLSLLGGLAGLPLVVGLRALLIRIAPENLPRLHESGINWIVLAFALGISLLTGIVFGLAPAIQLARTNLVGSLKEGARGTSGGLRQSRLRGVLVACEVGLSLMLMAGAGLLLRSFLNVLGVNPGFNPKNVLVANIWMPAPNDPKNTPYFERSARTVFAREVMRRVKALPGVEAVAMGTGDSIPLTGWATVPVAVEGKTFSEPPSAQITSVTPDFFRLLQTRLVRGRFFTEMDENPPNAVLLDETAVKRFFPNEDALNKRVRVGRSLNAPWSNVVGVVENIKTDGLDAPSVPHVYMAMYQNSNYAMTVFLRSSSDPSNLGEALRREIQNVDRDLPVFGVKTLEQVVAGSLAQRKFALQMVGAFASVALLLAAIGIYGVTAFSVSQRTQEIGVRMALGAQRRDVVRLVLRQGLVMTLWGLAGGLAGSVLLTRFLRSLLFAESPLDPLTLFAVSLVLATAAVVACYVPAIRAMRVDPVVALRCD